jgi:hypothetical protein
VTVAPDPDRAKASGTGYAENGSGLAIAMIDGPASLAAGVPARLRFRLDDRATGTPRGGLADVRVLAFSPAGWQRRYTAVPDGPEAYAVELTPPRPGAYYFFVEAPSAGLRLNTNWFLTLEAKEIPR